MLSAVATARRTLAPLAELQRTDDLRVRATNGVRGLHHPLVVFEMGKPSEDCRSALAAKPDEFGHGRCELRVHDRRLELGFVEQDRKQPNLAVGQA